MRSSVRAARHGTVQPILIIILATVCAAGLVAASLPRAHYRTLLLVTAAACALTGCVVALLARRSWSSGAITGVPTAVFLVLGVLAGAVAGGLEWALPGYLATFLYVGIVSSSGTSTRLALPALAGVALAVLGNQPAADGPSLALAVLVAATAGELVAYRRSRESRVKGGLRQVLGIAGLLLACDDVPVLVDRIAERCRRVLDADGGMVLLADPADSAAFLAQGAALASPSTPGAQMLRIPKVVNTDLDLTGIGVAVRTREPFFVRHAGEDGRWDPEFVHACEAASVVYIPLLGRDGVPGVFVGWWRHDRRELGEVGRAMSDLLLRQAGPVLERIRALTVLEEQATTDPLTGLANRRTFKAALSGLPADGAVALLDLDHFKQLNDTFGHAVGDKALTAFAGVLAQELRVADCTARYGGEEFAIALSSAAAAVLALDRLRDRWEEISKTCLPARYRITFSAGVATRGRGEHPDALLHRADVALYEAKSTGRNRTVVDDADDPGRYGPAAQEPAGYEPADLLAG